MFFFLLLCMGGGGGGGLLYMHAPHQHANSTPPFRIVWLWAWQLILGITAKSKIVHIIKWLIIILWPLAIIRTLH